MGLLRELPAWRRESLRNVPHVARNSRRGRTLSCRTRPSPRTPSRMPVADAQSCERILRTHSRTFYLASLFLPPEKRRGALALYAFCRLADDIVDDATMRGTSPDEIRRRLKFHTRGLDTVFSGRPDSAVFREIAWTVQRFGVPREPLDELLDGVARDLNGCRYRTWSDLEAYCEGVASS
ncbi:MAG TPA: squalene/phytoene synthase family protein, partial [Gemmatimonadaceae bacterium]|nr:squalene/phytoene synthase family protein [Gemmatimonadaceae bacterium]